ncbi:MAG: hypothetical protein KC933_30625, partial [Myxococcales bacterium]|nr:hypothetical protein [Myxococcales bacterium]
GRPAAAMPGQLARALRVASSVDAEHRPPDPRARPGRVAPAINRLAGAATTIALTTLSVLIAGAVGRSFPTTHDLVVALIVVAGALYGLGVGVALARAAHPGWGLGASVVIVAAVLAVAASAALGRINHAAFGLTVYGLVPLPLVDLTLGAHGGLHLRPKRHEITAEEVQGLRDDGAELVIIGLGWEERARLDPRLEGDPTVVALPTGEALEAFEQARAAGKRVALLVHTTC